MKDKETNISVLNFERDVIAEINIKDSNLEFSLIKEDDFIN